MTQFFRRERCLVEQIGLIGLHFEGLGKKGEGFIIPAGVYSLFMFANGALFARFMYKRNVRSAEVATAEAAG